MSLRLELGVLFLLCGTLTRADTLSVGSLGSGADFDSLQGAVAAAMPGDLILVENGDWDGLGGVIIDKSLTIIGGGGDASLGGGYSGIYTLGTSAGESEVPLQIRDLGPGEQVRIVGLFLHNTERLSQVLSITDCQGAIVLCDVRAETAQYPRTFTPGMAMVLNSKQVSLNKCDFRGSDGAYAFYDPNTYSLGQAGLYALNSNLSVNDCDIYGASTDYDRSHVSHGGAGIEAINSTLHISASDIRGGLGTRQQADHIDPSIAGDGGAGLSGVGSRLVVSFGRRARGFNRVGGGDAGDASLPASAKGGAAILVDAGSSIVMADDLQLFAGVDSDQVTLGALVQGLGAQVSHPEALASLQASPASATPGGGVTLRLSGEPGSIFVTYFSQGLGLGRQFGGILGSAVLDLGSLSRLPMEVLDTNGDGLISLSVPATPSVVGLSFLTQGLLCSPGGVLSISPPALVAVH